MIEPIKPVPPTRPIYLRKHQNFKADTNDKDIFRKPDLTSDNYVQSAPKSQVEKDIEEWRAFCQPIKPLTEDVFEKEKTNEQLTGTCKDGTETCGV